VVDGSTGCDPRRRRDRRGRGWNDGPSEREIEVHRVKMATIRVMDAGGLRGQVFIVF
jgi:hypothetical protein